MKTKQRFEIDTEGMRALQKGREDWQLVKELIANVWDASTSLCEVNLNSISPTKAKLVVRDDGEGFSNVNDVWTLMGHTEKRLDSKARGRFNIGEKEIISVAEQATIQTWNEEKGYGHIITFPKTGGREVKKVKSLPKGTEITCILSWRKRQVEEVIKKLELLLVPINMSFTINGKNFYSSKPYKVVDATLETVLQASLGEPLRKTRRQTSLELYSSEKGRLYEMGIPIQDIECPYLINVMQKVPMPPNRDVVSNSYLQDIYVTVLNATAEELNDDSVSATWVRTGVEDKEVKPDVVKTIINKRYGEKSALWSTDTKANENAIANGYEVIHPKSLSPIERATMINEGELQHTSDIFKTKFGTEDIIPEEEWTQDMWNIVNYSKRLYKKLLHKPLKVTMYKLPKSDTAADFSNFSSLLRFNVSNLGKSWFEGFHYYQTALLLHEFAHTKGDGHNWKFDKQLEALSGKAVHLALENPDIFGTNKG